MQGLTQKAVTFKGKFFSFDNVPMELEPFQKPHPPIWIGAVERRKRGARRAQRPQLRLARAPPRRRAKLTDSYRAAWKDAHGDKPLPKLGLGRFIVVGDTDAAAMALARRAYKVWHDSFHHLWRKHGTVPTQGERAREFDEIMDGGRGVAGTPDDLHQDAARRSSPKPASTIRSGSSCSAT